LYVPVVLTINAKEKDILFTFTYITHVNVSIVEELNKITKGHASLKCILDSGS